MAAGSAAERAEAGGAAMAKKRGREVAPLRRHLLEPRIHACKSNSPRLPSSHSRVELRRSKTVRGITGPMLPLLLGQDPWGCCDGSMLVMRV